MPHLWAGIEFRLLAKRASGTRVRRQSVNWPAARTNQLEHLRVEIGEESLKGRDSQRA